MASFRKRGSGGWQVQVRRKGYPPQSKSFSTRAAAVQWVQSIEYEMDQGLFVSRNEADTTTVGELSKSRRSVDFIISTSGKLPDVECWFLRRDGLAPFVTIA